MTVFHAYDCSAGVLTMAEGGDCLPRCSVRTRRQPLCRGECGADDVSCVPGLSAEFGRDLVRLTLGLYLGGGCVDHLLGCFRLRHDADNHPGGYTGNR